MILGLLAVEEEGLVDPVGAGQRARRRRDKRNALVGRAEHGVKAVADGLLHQSGVELAEAGILQAGAVVARVDEIRGVAAALRHEIAEAHHVRAHHKLDKLFLCRCQHKRTHSFPKRLSSVVPIIPFRGRKRNRQGRAAQTKNHASAPEFLVVSCRFVKHIGQ